MPKKPLTVTLRTDYWLEPDPLEGNRHRAGGWPSRLGEEKPEGPLQFYEAYPRYNENTDP